MSSRRSPTATPTFEGFDREVIDALSTRSAEIANGWRSTASTASRPPQVAAYRTRDKKDYGVDEDERREEWIATAEPHGVTPESVGAMVAEAAPASRADVGAEDLDRRARQVGANVLALRPPGAPVGACDQLPEGADRAALTAAVDQVLASERIVCGHESSGPLDFDQYTTPRLAEMEQRFIAAALDGADAGVAQVIQRDADRRSRPARLPRRRSARDGHSPDDRRRADHPRRRPSGHRQDDRA